MNPADYFKQNKLSISNLVAVQKPSANLVYLTDDFVLRVVRPELIAGRYSRAAASKTVGAFWQTG